MTIGDGESFSKDLGRRMTLQFRNSSATKKAAASEPARAVRQNTSDFANPPSTLQPCHKIKQKNTKNPHNSSRTTLFLDEKTAEEVEISRRTLARRKSHPRFIAGVEGNCIGLCEGFLNQLRHLVNGPRGSKEVVEANGRHRSTMARAVLGPNVRIPVKGIRSPR